MLHPSEVSAQAAQNAAAREAFHIYTPTLRRNYCGWWVIIQARRGGYHVADADRDLHVLGLRNPRPRGYLGFVDGLPAADEETVRRALGR
jgi:hypothetical protein